MKRLIAAVAVALAAATAAAQTPQPAALNVEAPWARATMPSQRAGGAYLKIGNAGAADRLVGASSAVAERIELHTMTMDGDVMRMRQLDAIDLPAGSTTELKPGGLHLMLVGLKAPLRDGDSFPIELRFEKAGALTVAVKVQSMPSDGMHKH